MYQRRIRIFMAAVAVLFAVLVGRLWHLQIISGSAYRRDVADALISSSPMPPAPRGRILDRNGEFLAVDRPCHELCLEYGLLSGEEQWVKDKKRRLKRDEKLSDADADRVFAERVANTWRLAEDLGGVTAEQLQESRAEVVRRVQAIQRLVSGPVREQREAHAILTGLTDEAATALKGSLDQMIGASVRAGSVRYYPHGDLACHVIGMVGAVSPEEQRRLNLPDTAPALARMQENYLDGDLTGKGGVEKLCESVLRSGRGYFMRKRTPDGYAPVQEVVPRQGRDVTLTIDHRLQKAIAETFVKLTAEQAAADPRDAARPGTGAVVVLSVPEGQVLAMVSLPGYDINNYRRDFDTLAHDRLMFPLLNRAIYGQYPIGSTAKAFTAMAGLKAGVIGLETSFNCSGSIAIGGGTFLHCWTSSHHVPPHGHVAVVEALKYSCNIFFYNVGARVGLERLSEFLVLAGFGDEPGTGLAQESSGSVPTPQWLATRMPSYHPVVTDAMQVAIGQGFLRGTPLQVANGMAAIARGGTWTTPTLILDGMDRPRQQRDFGVRPEHMAAVVEGLHRVVNSPGGTANKVFHGVGVEPLEGVEVYGKTGTATAVPTDLNGDGQIDDYERDRAEMAWFAGFALDRRGPQMHHGIAVAVLVEYVEGGGGSNAGPIAREAIRAWRALEAARAVPAAPADPAEPAAPAEPPAPAAPAEEG